MTPKFTRKTIPEREALGEKLAKKRFSLGYDIKETERATRIRAKHIEALESGDFSKLPPDVYVKGFLKNYAIFLKLDPVKVVNLYLRERGLSENIKKATTPEKNEPKKTKFKPQKVLITPKKLAIGSAIFSALLIVFYISWQISILAAPPKITITSPADNTKVEEDSIIVDGFTDSGSDVFINNIQISATPDGKFKEKVSLQEGVNLINITSKNKLGKQTDKSITVLSKPQAIIINNNGQDQDLVAKFDIGPNSVSFYIEVDGKPLSEKNAVMLPGSVQTVRAKEKIVITASDGGSVRVNLNGNDLGVLGRPGEKINNKEYNKNSI